MENIPPELARNAVHAFLNSLYDKKTEKEQKQLTKAIEDNDIEKISTLKATLAEAKAKYSVTEWIPDAATRMAKQLNFGTHISKGVHPDAKGDNVSFDSVNNNNNLPITLVGTHSINSHYIDANGNAAALPLAAFFDFAVTDSTKIRDLILADNPDFINSLVSDDVSNIDNRDNRDNSDNDDNDDNGNNQKTIANDYHQAFKTALQNLITNPSTHERNKQTLWPINAYHTSKVEQAGYITVIPLYPSVLTHEVYQRINHLKFSDENKTARDNRFKKTAEQKPYVSLFDLATVQLGGTKPQNVSLLMSKQGGRNYLLPSLPPIIGHSYSYKLSKFSDSIFGKSLAYHARDPIDAVIKIVKDHRPIMEIRNARKRAIDEILHRLFAIAEDIRTTLPAGWSKEYDLNEYEKLWLDPMRAELEGEEEFKARREDANTEWDKQIIHHFARWLNTLLQTEFADMAHDFADPEHIEWEREIEAMKKRYERAGKGVFL